MNDQPDPLPLTIISGYLGAGKTSLVNHLLRHANGRRLMVMVNDFGELPIDAALIETRDGDTINLANGCVCCSMGGDLFDALVKVLDTTPRPDHLLIEASGVADPAKIANIARAEPDLRLDAIVSLVDAGNFEQLLNNPLIGQTLAHQVKISDIIVLNKLDLADTEARNTLRETIAEIAPDAPWLETRNAKVPIDLVIGPQAVTSSTFTEMPDHGDHGAAYAKWSMFFEHPVERDQLEKTLSRLDTSVLRLKGIVHLKGSQNACSVQCVGQRCTITPMEKNMSQKPSGLIAIGLANRLDKPALDRLFASLQQ